MLTLKKIHVIFPQFTRFFSAKPTQKVFKAAGNTLLWLGIATLAILNVNLIAHRSSSSALEEPSINHLQRAQKLWSNGQRKQAQSELWNAFSRESIAKQISSDKETSPVLGASNEDSSVNVNNISRAKLESQYQYWETLVAKHPTYRDGWVALTMLGYQLNYKEHARTHLDQVVLIDPNYNMLPELEKLISSMKK